MAFDINSKAAIGLTVKLGKLSRVHLPVAVSQTLNRAAFETKSLLPKTASRKFVTRNKSFFRAFSSVERSRGFNINNMKSVVGINSAKGSKVADGLEKQETGGNIQGRKLIPHDKGRVSGSHAKRVRRKNRFDKINITDVRRRKGRGKTNYLLIKKGGKGTVFEVKKTGKRQKLVPVYSYRNSKTSRVKPSPFMKPASLMALKMMPRFYIEEAQKRFIKAMK